MSKHQITDLKILIAIPTYKRAGNVPSLALFDPEDAHLFVDTQELDLYRKEHPTAKIVEYNGTAGLTPKLNAILDYARKNKYDAVFKMDDDFEGMAYFADGYTQRLVDPARIYQVIERMAVMARDARTPLFVTLGVPDIRKYKRSDPFSLFATLKIGAYGLLLDNDLRFDERMLMKQDIDMCLQVLLNHRFFIQDNRYSFYYRPTMGNKGGVASYRTREKEEQMMAILRKKWGEQMFGAGTSDRASIYTLNIANPFKN
jgi:hypothetical protein